MSAQIDPHDETEVHDHDRGLSFDLATLLGRTRALSRRNALKLMAGAGAGLVVLAACGDDDDAGSAPTTGATAATAGTAATSTTAAATTTSGSTATTAASSTSASGDAADLEQIPEETAGPYPGDGSNGPNVLTESGIVRRDVRPSFGSSTTVAEGVPLAIDLTIVDSTNDGAPLPGAAVYVWHCDREGRYSMYSQGVTGENYLRGVQEADATGKLSFTSIFPACYSGRWPHIHFEVYPSLAQATSAGSTLATSQVALPEDISDAVYATAGYEQSVSNMQRVSLTSDMVFRDGVELQTPTVSGTVDSGITIALTVAV
jgi:protocatechuate 3,4-dioxygenase beta subunit